jgi:DNA-binding LytR/AlgR family response regulator
VAHAPIRETRPPLRERRPFAVHASPAGLRMLVRGLVLAAAAGAFMAAVGAFGSGVGPAPVRFGYWIGVMLVGAVGGWAIAMLIGEARFRRRPWLTSALMVLLTAPWMTVVVWYATAKVYGAAPTLQALAWFVPPVLLVSIAMVVLSRFVHRGPAITHAAPEGAPPPRFLERLPLRLRGAELYAVQAEDHYLRLHTSRGSDLILMRLSDAIAELEGLEGARTHRSWWVAREAVVDARRGDGRAVLKLKGDLEAPVSRTYAPALRQARWW